MLMHLPDAIPLDSAGPDRAAADGWHMLHTIYGIEPGETVLINAIGGGVGLFTTQLAVKAGARVIALSARPEGASGAGIRRRARRRHSQRGFRNGCSGLHRRRGVDLAIDSLGATMLDRTFNVVRNSGTSSASAKRGTAVQEYRERILPRSQTFTRLHIGHVDADSQAWKDSLINIPQGVLDGWLKVPMAGVFPMADAAGMHRHIESAGCRQAGAGDRP